MADNYYYGTHTGQQLDAAIETVGELVPGTMLGANAIVLAGSSVKHYPIKDENSVASGADESLATLSLVTSNFRTNRSNARKACTGVFIENVSSLPATYTQLATMDSTLITENYYCISMRLSNPAAQAGDWTVTTEQGKVTVSGEISGTTDIILFLADPYWA